MHWEYIKEDWKVQVNGVEYDLSHLKALRLPISIPQSGRFQACSFNLHVKFSSHCVTEGKERYIQKVKITPCFLITDEGGSDRCFSKERFELSLGLPRILEAITKRPCYLTKHGRNFVIVEGVNQIGNAVKYHVYFRVTKKKRRVELFVESAYVPAHKRRLGPKVQGWKLLVKTYRGEKIKSPRV